MSSNSDSQGVTPPTMPTARLLLTVAGIAAACQAVTTLGAFAWLSRTLPIAEVGRFGLHLAILSFVLALDGIRQGVVVAITTAADEVENKVRHMAALALLLGVVVGAATIVGGRWLIGLGWSEVMPLALTAFLLLTVSPGMGRLEANGGPHWSAALHSAAWSTAIVIAAFLANWSRAADAAAWAMLAAPTMLATVLGFRGYLVCPSFRPDASARRVASQGLGSHAVTALAGLIDRVVVAISLGPAALGLYTPVAELTARASALGGLVANLFLRDEASSTLTRRAGPAGQPPHLVAVNVAIVLAGLGVVVAATFAGEILDAFVARSNCNELLTFRLLLAALALNFGAQWSAVALRARGEFDLYRPYVASLVGAAFVAPWLVTTYGIVGAAMTVLVLRTADMALIFRARGLLTRTQIGAVASSTLLSLVLAAVGQHCGPWTRWQ